MAQQGPLGYSVTPQTLTKELPWAESEIIKVSVCRPGKTKYLPQKQLHKNK